MKSEINQSVSCVLIGKSQSFGPNGELSAYVKTLFGDSAVLTKHGIVRGSSS